MESSLPTLVLGLRGCSGAKKSCGSILLIRRLKTFYNYLTSHGVIPLLPLYVPKNMTRYSYGLKCADTMEWLLVCSN